MKRISLLLLALALTAGCGPASDGANDSQASDVSAAASAEAAVGGAAAESPAAPNEAAAESQARPEDAAAAAAAPAGDESIELAQADLDAVEALGYVSGQHYRRLSPAQPTSSTAGRVEVIEFFMYSCPHCSDLEPYVENWVDNKPEHIDFVRVPVTWNAGAVFHAQAFYTAKALDKVDDTHAAFFREFHLQQNYLDTPEKLAAFYSGYGVSEEDFESTFDSFAVNTELRRAQELGTRFRIDSTPTFIVNGKYRTDVSSAGGTPEQLFELIEALAAAERGQG